MYNPNLLRLVADSKQDLLTVFSWFGENPVYKIFSESGDLLAIYDGKNSVPEEFNSRIVCKISADGETLKLVLQDPPEPEAILQEDFDPFVAFMTAAGVDPQEWGRWQ